MATGTLTSQPAGFGVENDMDDVQFDPRRPVERCATESGLRCFSLADRATSNARSVTVPSSATLRTSNPFRRTKE